MWLLQLAQLDYSLAMFVDEYGNSVPTCSEDELYRYVELSTHELGLPREVQTALAASAFAMVVRSSLALSAKDSLLAALVAPGLAGDTVLSTCQMLLGAGVSTLTLFYSEELSEAQKAKEQHLLSLGAKSQSISKTQPLPDLNAHCLLVGVASDSKDKNTGECDYSAIANSLNESSLPSHCVLRAPEDANGRPLLFCSSTLCLGLPLTTLLSNEDYYGRIYLADIGLQPKLLAEHGVSLPYIFAEQPVIRLSRRSND